MVILGSNCGVEDFGAIVKAAQLCDEIGVDTISTGATVSLTMEVFERGLISKKDTEGVEARFGDPHALIDLIHIIVEKRGIGAHLAEGMGSVARARPEWKLYILAVKGLPFAAYDPRGFLGKALTFGTANHGACHNVGGWTVRAELMSGEYDRFEWKGKGELVKTLQDNRAYVDSIGVCTVVSGSMGFSDHPEGKVLQAVTGNDFTPELLEIGARISNLERLILNREGIRRHDDMIPHRIMNDPVESGPTKGRIVGEEIYNMMRDDYYQARGWTGEGVVDDTTLRKLGLVKMLSRKKR